MVPGRAPTAIFEETRARAERGDLAAIDDAAVQGLVDASADVRRSAVEACIAMERTSVLAWDPTALGRWIGIHERVAAAPGDGPSALDLDGGRSWRLLIDGQTAAADEAARSLFRSASEAGAAALVIEATVQRALIACARGDLAEATDLGRRAARMAQTEAIAHGELLAHLVLARVRRLSARPHLALHILSALAQVAPVTWQPWIAWETRLSGGTSADAWPAPLDSWPSARAARALAATLDAAGAGDRRGFTAAAAALEAATAPFGQISREAQTVIAVIDPERPAPTPEVASWSAGATADTPAGLHALGVQEGADETAFAYVAASPGGAGRRLLRPGLPLFGAARVLEREGAAARGGGRTNAGIAALALAGPEGLSREQFFRHVYLFAFVPHLHQGILDLLVHRMRTRLGAAGQIRRGHDDHVLVLDPSDRIAVPDPRCMLPVAESVLRALVSLGPASANEAADRLRMPLRSVQAALRQLVEDGACVQDRSGRRVAYRVHDTTFTEVTIAARTRK